MQPLHDMLPAPPNEHLQLHTIDLASPVALHTRDATLNIQYPRHESYSLWNKYAALDLDLSGACTVLFTPYAADPVHPRCGRSGPSVIQQLCGAMSRGGEWTLVGAECWEVGWFVDDWRRFMWDARIEVDRAAFVRRRIGEMVDECGGANISWVSLAEYKKRIGSDWDAWGLGCAGDCTCIRCRPVELSPEWMKLAPL